MHGYTVANITYARVSSPRLAKRLEPKAIARYPQLDVRDAVFGEALERVLAGDTSAALSSSALTSSDLCDLELHLRAFDDTFRKIEAVATAIKSSCDTLELRCAIADCYTGECSNLWSVPSVILKRLVVDTALAACAKLDYKASIAFCNADTPTVSHEGHLDVGCITDATIAAEAREDIIVNTLTLLTAPHRDHIDPPSTDLTRTLSEILAVIRSNSYASDTLQPILTALEHISLAHADSCLADVEASDVRVIAEPSASTTFPVLGGALGSFLVSWSSGAALLLKADESMQTTIAFCHDTIATWPADVLPSSATSMKDFHAQCTEIVAVTVALAKVG